MHFRCILDTFTVKNVKLSSRITSGAREVKTYSWEVAHPKRLVFRLHVWWYPKPLRSSWEILLSLLHIALLIRFSYVLFKYMSNFLWFRRPTRVKKFEEVPRRGELFNSKKDKQVAWLLLLDSTFPQPFEWNRRRLFNALFFSKSIRVSAFAPPSALAA